MNRLLTTLACLLTSGLLLTLTSLPAAGTLPPSINGQPLPSLAPMLAKVTPAVVNISSKHRVQARDPFFEDPFLRRFFGLPPQARQRVQQSLGSGVIVNADKGYILTNNHVVDHAEDITVALQDGRKFKATIVGTDPATDIAVIRIDANKLTALPVADSSKLRVGDFVVAVGEPFGFGQTVTSGIVSALNRSGLGNTYQRFIQTDASINPGNSGGPLVNLAGQMVGINSMIYSPSGASAGIGFAIPSNLAMHVMRQLVTYGHVRRGLLGVETQDVSARIARALGLDEARGAVVTRVQPGSPAAASGIRSGDVILAINGNEVDNSDALDNAVGLLTVGKEVKLTVQRHGKTWQATTHLAPENLAHSAGAKLDPRLAGAELRELSKHERDNGLHGIAVVQVARDSRAAANGLQSGDRIIGIGRVRVDSLARLKQDLNRTPAQLVLTIARGNRAMYLRMR